MSDYGFQLEWHLDRSIWPEWGSAPRGPLVRFDFAHQGEWLDSVIGPHPRTGKDMVYQVVRCEYCIACHLWPLSDPTDLADYYRTTFYEKTKPDYLARYAQDRVWWEATHRTILAAAAAWLPSPPRLFLDVGAGSGHALTVAREMGYATVALEPGPLAAAVIRSHGHVVWEHTLADYPTEFASVRFSMVYAYEVLEHQSNPEDFVLQCYDVLRPGGVLVIVVPNDYNPLQFQACAQLGLPHYWLSAPDHQFYFSPKCLQLLLRRCGFEILDCRGTFPMEDFLIGGRNYVGHDDIGRLCHQQRMRTELAAVAEGRWPEVEAEYRANLPQRIGREMIFWGRKIV